VAVAEPPAKSARPTTAANVAVIDVQYIFKHHKGFIEAMQKWQAEVAAADADAKLAKDTLERESKKLTNGELHPGTPVYKETQDKVTVAQSVFTLGIQRKKDELVRHKADLYGRVYREMLEAVEKIAKAKGLSLVVQYDGDTLNPDKPDDILRQIGQVVVWHAKDHDITADVLAGLNREKKAK
jgi:Skp family chaperone for outer membrane proteins